MVKLTTTCRAQVHLVHVLCNQTDLPNVINGYITYMALLLISCMQLITVGALHMSWCKNVWAPTPSSHFNHWGNTRLQWITNLYHKVTSMSHKFQVILTVASRHDQLIIQHDLQLKLFILLLLHLVCYSSNQDRMFWVTMKTYTCHTVYTYSKCAQFLILVKSQFNL